MAWLGSWECFVKVVECGSMAAAARRLDCTRAQVSKQVAELERTFGVRLFERTTRRLALTASGEVFYQHALRAIEAVETTDVAVRNMGDTPRGVLRISATIAFGRLFIAPLLPQLVARYPLLECELILTDQIVDLVDDNIDLALRMTRVPPEDAVVRKLAVLRRVICGAPAYLAAHGVPQQPEELGRHRCFNLLAGERTGSWRLADGAGEEVTVPVGGAVQFNHVECVRDAVLAGQGLAILPTYLVGPDLAAGRLQTVLDAYAPVSTFGRHLYACYAPSRGRASKVRVLLEALEALFSPVPPWEAGTPGGGSGG